MKNVEKSPLGWVFISLIHRLNVNMKPSFLAHVKEYIDIFLESYMA